MVILFSRALLSPLLQLLAVVPVLWAAPVRAEAVHSHTADYLGGLHSLYQNDFPVAADLLARVLETPEGAADDGLRATVLAATLRAGLFPQALESVAGSPQISPMARFMLALDALKGGDPQRATALLDGSAEDWVRKGLHPVVLAWAAALQADREGAIAALAPLAALSPSLAAYTEGRILEQLNDPQAAEAAYRRVDQEIIRLPEPVFRALARLQLRQAGAGASAAMFATYLDENPNLIELRQDRDVLAATGAFPPWADTPETAIAEVLYHVAVGFASEAWMTALDLARLAQWLDPRKDRAALLIAGILENQGRYQESRALYQQIPPDSPYSLLARRGIAANMHDLGEEKAAIAMLEDIARGHPRDTGALQLLGRIYQSEKNYPRMADTFARLIDSASPDDPDLWSYHYRRAIALERQKQFPRAEPHFLKALELNPDQPDVLNYLGYSWVDMGINLERGLKMLETAVRKNDSGYIIDSLGWAYYRTGDYGRAVETLERAAALEPREAVIFDHLGDAYWKVGRFREARYQWARALTIESPDVDAAAVRAKLARECPVSCGHIPGAE